MCLNRAVPAAEIRYMGLDWDELARQVKAGERQPPAWSYAILGVLVILGIFVVVLVVRGMAPKNPELCDQVTRAGHADVQTYADACR